MDGTGPGAAGLGDELAVLKRRGCTVLVASDPGGGAALCPELLGRPTLDRRHVLVATTTSVADLLARRGREGHDPARLGVVDAATAARRDGVEVTAGTAGAVDRSTEWYGRVDDLADLPTLARAVADHVRRVAPPDPEPGQVRLCLDSLDPFLDAADGATTFRFLHLLAGVVRGARGLGHVHVAAGSLADLDVEALFDATVRVRSDPDGTARQHWTVHGSGRESGWLPVGEGPA